MAGNSINGNYYQPYFPGQGHGGYNPGNGYSGQQMPPYPPIFPYFMGGSPQQMPTVDLFNGMPPWGQGPQGPQGPSRPQQPFPVSPPQQPDPATPEEPESAEGSPAANNRNAGETAIVEVGGPEDEHAQNVQDVYEQHNPDGENKLYSVYGDDAEQNGLPAGNKTQDVKHQDVKEMDENENEPEPIKDKAELDAYIDAASTDAFAAFGEQVDNIVKNGDASVINGSLGYSRNDIYVDILGSLKENPELAKEMGLKPDDIKNLETDKDGNLLIDEKVGKAIAKYVDDRMDAKDSAYQKAKAEYQEITQNAADNGVTIVVAAGNEHELNSVFERDNPGGDTNFLAQSHSVISVAATDNNGTKQIDDDTIADFSSRGDGEFNPTVATNGVNVKTENGEVNGTSFSAPKVAAIVARLQKENPHLSFEQIKELLQESAFDSDAPELAEGAGIFNPNAFMQGGLAA